MGFTALAATAAALPKAFEGYTAYQQGKVLNKTAKEQIRLTESQAKDIEHTAATNQQRAARNANASMASARADAGASNLATDGSVAVRERDLATRLQDEIKANANAALDQANKLRQQGAYNAWQTRQHARQSYAAALGSGFSTIGSIFQVAAGGTENSSETGSGKL